MKGDHGFDPAQVPDMRAIFFAAGPEIRRSVRLPAFENVDVYPFVAEILGLSIGPIDGRLEPLRKALVAAPAMD